MRRFAHFSWRPGAQAVAKRRKAGLSGKGSLCKGVCGWMRRPLPRRPLLLLAAASVLAWLGGANAYVLNRGAGEPVLAAPPPVLAASAPEAPVIVVLGAGVRADGAPSMVLRDRLETALDLWKQGISQKILVSGDHGREGYDELGPSRAYLTAAGVPDDDVFLDHAGFDTYSTFWRAHRVFGARRVVVVTQAFHLPRALYLARAEGLVATGAAADRRVYPFAVRYAAREVVSRAVAPLYVLLERRPRAPGGGVDLLGATYGHATHDPHD